MRSLLAVTLLGLASGVALAAAPTSAQKAEFHQVCLAISGDAALCACKADAAMSLIDERFMGVVIDAMKGKSSPAEADYKAYNTYVGRSNQVCKPNY